MEQPSRTFSLRGTAVHPVRSFGEDDLADFIVQRLRSSTKGAEPTTVAAVLAQFADDSLHQKLSAADIWSHLATHGITPRDLSNDASVARLVTDSADSYLARLQALCIGGHDIPRPEATTAFDHLVGGTRVVLAGAAGAGKSVVSSQTVTLARNQGWPVLVLSADRLPDVATSAQLGEHLGLPDSPVAVLAGFAAGRDALLVVDQLDAVSVVSGRHSEQLALVNDLLREARSHSGLRVLLACRQFDIDNDRALRAIAHDKSTATVSVGGLSDDQLRVVLTTAGLESNLPDPLMRLLAVPLHLALYVEASRDGAVDAARSARTLTDLYNSFWTAKRNACRTLRGGIDDWSAVVDYLVQRMSVRQELSVPEAVLDELDQQTRVMASEGVLSISQGRIGFFHETFFDYCFARHFVATGGTLRTLLTATDQDLFRRAQVRQVLVYERRTDFAGYLADFKWLISSPEVRLHIKALVISLLDTTPNPTREEWEAIRSTAENEHAPLNSRVWQAIRRNSGWFPVLDAAGVWATMLQSGGERAERGLWALTGSAADHAPQVIEILNEAPKELWRARRNGFLQMADLHRARPLVDTLLEMIHDGDVHLSEIDLDGILHRLAKAHPAWAAEVLAAAVQRAASDPEAAAFQPGAGLPRDLTIEIRAIAANAPGEYVEHLLPELLELIRLHARPEWSNGGLIHDALWSYHLYRGHGSMRDDLYDGMGIALAALAEADSVRAATVFRQLQSQPYESAAFLLALGYTTNPAVFADEAADWLTTTPGALFLGYSDSPAWVTRQLIAAITLCCSQERFDQLVHSLMYYAPPHERTYEGLRSRGITELCLLNGINPARRTTPLKRRLEELRRKFGRDDAPPPEGITGGTVPPPIPADIARRMSDRQWLDAMQRHGNLGIRWRDGQLLGDAWSQSQVLEAVTKEAPHRFARLLLTIPPGTAEAYVVAILRGLEDARLDSDLLVAVCRHAHEIGDSDVNRWLVRLVQAHAAGCVPEELLRLVADIAIADQDPAHREPGEDWNGGSIDSAALNSTRGAAALALADLLAEDADRVHIILPALQQLVADPQPEVRAAAIAALTPLLYTDPTQALEMFRKAINEITDELLGSHYVERYVDHAVRLGHYHIIAATVRRMLASADDDTRRVGARRLAVASYHFPELDNEVDTILRSEDDVTRAAAVQVFADNITFKPRRGRSAAIIAAAFHDPAKSVRDAAERAFYRIGDQRLSDYVSLITAFATSPALADGAAGALHSLETSRNPLPLELLDVCEAFVAAHQRDIGNIATAASGDAMYVTRLALRMHAQHPDPDLRRRCLDLIDQLVASQAHGIERDLDTIER